MKVFNISQIVFARRCKPIQVKRERIKFFGLQGREIEFATAYVFDCLMSRDGYQNPFHLKISGLGFFSFMSNGDRENFMMQWESFNV